MSQTLCKLHGRDIAVCSVVCLTQAPQASWSAGGCQERLWGPGIFTTEIQQGGVVGWWGGGSQADAWNLAFVKVLFSNVRPQSKSIGKFKLKYFPSKLSIFLNWTVKYTRDWYAKINQVTCKHFERPTKMLWVTTCMW